MKRVELTIEDDSVPAVLTALGQLKGVEALAIKPVRVRVRKAKGEPAKPE